VWSGRRDERWIKAEEGVLKITSIANESGIETEKKREAQNLEKCREQELPRRRKRRNTKYDRVC